jgi:predicted Rossmann-fold nucleotide-binding protein
MDELFEVLCLVQTKRIEPVPVILVGKEFWSRAFDVQFLVDEGVIDELDASLFITLETAEEIWAHIVDWWQRRGVDVLGK